MTEIWDKIYSSEESFFGENPISFSLEFFRINL